MKDWKYFWHVSAIFCAMWVLNYLNWIWNLKSCEDESLNVRISRSRCSIKTDPWKQILKLMFSMVFKQILILIFKVTSSIKSSTWSLTWISMRPCILRFFGTLIKQVSNNQAFEAKKLNHLKCSVFDHEYADTTKFFDTLDNPTIRYRNIQQSATPSNFSYNLLYNISK